MKKSIFQKIFYALIFIIIFSSCSQKKNEGAETPPAEEEKELTQEEFLKERFDEFLAENPYFTGFYTRKQGDIKEIRLEDGKYFWIDYESENEEYVEKDKSEIFMMQISQEWVPGIYNINNILNVLNYKNYIRYDTLEDAVMGNYLHDYGPGIKMKSVKATSVLDEKYPAENLIDGTYKSWAEGEDGSGIGTKITFEFVRPYMFEDYTNYACINIVNGFGDLKYYYQNNRVKDMRLWIDDDPVPVKISLYDSHLMQSVVLRKYLGNRYVKKLSLEILSVYPGTKYDDTCIAEIYIGPYNEGFEMSLDSYNAELIYAYYRDLEDDAKHFRFNKGNLEYYWDKGHDPRMDWTPILMMPKVFYYPEFYFDGDTPIIVKPGEVQNQKDIDDNWRYDDFEGDSCLPLYKDIKLYAYKNGGWKTEKSNAVMSEIEKVLAEHEGEYFTFASDNRSRLYSGVNDGEDINYSVDDTQRFIELVFYKDKPVLFGYNKDNTGTYVFKYDGKKYVREK